MIARLHRFHGYGSLRGVYQRGQTVRGPQLSLKFARRPGNRPFRVAVVVSRKVSKSAVRRNRMRRRIYEAVRRIDPPVPAGTDLVFTAYSEQLLTMDSGKLHEAVGELLQKAANRRNIGQT